MKNPAQAGFFVVEPDVVWMITFWFPKPLNL
jgi:hypothetical protein